MGKRIHRLAIPLLFIFVGFLLPGGSLMPPAAAEAAGGTTVNINSDFQVTVPTDLAQKYAWDNGSFENSEWLTFYDRSAYEAGKKDQSAAKFSICYYRFNDYPYGQGGVSDRSQLYLPTDDRIIAMACYNVKYSACDDLMLLTLQYQTTVTEELKTDAAQIVFTLTPCGELEFAGLDASWNVPYADFVIDGHFREAGQDYGSEADILASLYDMDQDGTPELLLTNGYEGRAVRCAYIYTYTGGKVQYLGTGPTDAFLLSGTGGKAYPGIIGEFRDGTSCNISYYSKSGLTLKSEEICTKVNETDLIPKTGDNELLHAVQDGYDALPHTSLWDIYSGGSGWYDLLAAGKYYLSSEGSTSLPQGKAENGNAESATLSYAGAVTPIEPAMFEDSALNFNINRAKLGAMLSCAAEKGLKDICQCFYDMGIEDADIYDQNYDKDRYAFAIAVKPMIIKGVKENIIFMVARGSCSTDEYMGDRFTGAESEFYGYTAYDIAAEFQNDILQGFITFLGTHSELASQPMKFFITGHSLGGAAANLLAAYFDINGKTKGMSNRLKKDDIYAYTFGAIDSIKDTDEINVPVADNFENIHNIYNFYDSFGPNGFVIFTTNANSEFGKFGHIDEFAKQYSALGKDAASNHLIENYLDAILKGKVKCKSRFSNSYLLCPVDIEVIRDSDQTVVARITDNTVDDTLTGDENVGVLALGDAKEVIIFGDDSYTIRATATDDGTMTVGTKYFNENGEGSAETVYPEVELEDGRTFAMQVTGEEKPELQVVEGGEVIGTVGTDGKITNTAAYGAGSLSLTADKRDVTALILTAVIAGICAVQIVLLLGIQKKRR